MKSFRLPRLPSRSIREWPVIRLIAVISFFGQLYFFVPVMTPYLLQRQLTIAEIAGLQTTLLLTQLVMELPTGIIADRLGHAWSYRLALATLVIGEVVFLFSRDYPAFLAAQIVTGTGYAFASGSVDALIYESLPETDRTIGMQRARGWIGAATHSASVVAYSIGGVITASQTIPRMTITIVMGIGALAIATLLSLLLREAPHLARIARPTSVGLLRRAGSVVRVNRDVQRLLTLSLLTNAFGAHLLVFYQQYFLDTGVEGIWFGLALSLGSIVAIAAQLHAWRLSATLGTSRALLVATVLPGVLYLSMAVVGHPVIAVGLFIVQWGAIHLAGPLFSGLFNAHLPDEARATSLSLINAIVTIYIGSMGLLLGWLSSRSLPAMFALIGTVIVAGALLIRIDGEKGANAHADR
jgi:MFS family permease